MNGLHKRNANGRAVGSYSLIPSDFARTLRETLPLLLSSATSAPCEAHAMAIAPIERTRTISRFICRYSFFSAGYHTPSWFSFGAYPDKGYSTTSTSIFVTKLDFRCRASATHKNWHIMSRRTFRRMLSRRISVNGGRKSRLGA